MKKERQLYNIIWNLVGNFVYAICVWLLTFVISKHSGTNNYGDASMFAISASFANIFYVVANYGLRTYQVSDIHGNYTDEEYISSRIISAGIGGITCIITSIIFHYSLAQLAAIAIYMVYQCFRAYADVIHGVIQKNGRLDLCGKSLTVRGLAKIVMFTATLYLTGSLLLALTALAITGLLVIYLFDMHAVRKFYRGPLFSKNFMSKRVWNLLKTSFPMLLFMIFGNLTIYMPRIILEKLVDGEAVSIFAYVYAPTIAITTFATGIVLPFMPKMAAYYKEKNRSKLLRQFLIPVVMMVFIGICAMIVSGWIGDFVLRILYDSVVAEYKLLLVYTMLISTLWSLVYCFNNLLVTARELRSMTIMNALGFVITMVLCLIIIPKLTIYGTAYAMIIGILAQLLLTLIPITKVIKNINSTSENPVLTEE